MIEWGHSAIISALDGAVATFGPQTSQGVSTVYIYLVLISVAYLVIVTSQHNIIIVVTICMYINNHRPTLK